MLLIGSDYQRIRNAVLDHGKIPSFTSANPAIAPTYDMPWSGSLTLQDTNQVTNKFAVVSKPPAINYGMTTSSVTLSTSDPSNSAGTIKLSQNTSVKGLVFWHSGVQQVKATPTGAQQVIEAYLNIRAPKAGNLTIEKYNTVTNKFH